MNEFSPAIAALRNELQKHEQSVRETKRAINKLTELSGGKAPFSEAEIDATSSANIGNMRRDQFYGVPLATAIRGYLEMRRASDMGPATVNDMYSALLAGGFKFETKIVENAKRGLYVSLAKNTAQFHKLPGGSNETSVFGLREWYPSAKDEEDKTEKPVKKKQAAKAKPAKVAPKTEEPKETKQPPAPKKETPTPHSKSA